MVGLEAAPGTGAGDWEARRMGWACWSGRLGGWACWGSLASWAQGAGMQGVFVVSYAHTIFRGRALGVRQECPLLTRVLCMETGATGAMLGA